MAIENGLVLVVAHRLKLFYKPHWSEMDDWSDVILSFGCICLYISVMKFVCVY